MNTEVIRLLGTFAVGMIAGWYLRAQLFERFQEWAKKTPPANLGSSSEEKGHR